MRAFLFLGILISFYSSNSQTLIIAVRLGDELFVAADSRTRAVKDTLINGNREYIETLDTTKKIIPFGNYFLAFSGYPGMSLKRLASQIIIKDNLINTVKSFSFQWKTWLEKEFNKIRLSDSNNYRFRLSDISHSAILFFGYENDTIVSVALYSECTSKYNEPAIVELDILSGEEMDKDRLYVMMHGHSKDVDSLGFKYMHQYGILGGLKLLICKQAEKTPSIVFPPIHIIHLRDKRYEWSYHEKCD